MGKIIVLFLSEDEEDFYQNILQIMGESVHFECYNVIQEEKCLNIGRMKLNLAEKNVIIHGAEIMLTNREAASEGDVLAINTVLKHYEGYIITLSTRKMYDEGGRLAALFHS